MIRYTKYDTHGACHWKEYTKEGYYMKNVDDVLVQFKDAERGTLLDVGCGDGLPACKLAEMGFKVTGVDNEPKGIEIAKEMCKKKITWICQDIVEIESGKITRNEVYFDRTKLLSAIRKLKENK